MGETLDRLRAQMNNSANEVEIAALVEKIKAERAAEQAQMDERLAARTKVFLNLYPEFDTQDRRDFSIATTKYVSDPGALDFADVVMHIQKRFPSREKGIRYLPPDAFYIFQARATQINAGSAQNAGTAEPNPGTMEPKVRTM